MTVWVEKLNRRISFLKPGWWVVHLLGVGTVYALGAWWGVKGSVRGGEKFIRLVVSAAALLMALKLFNLF